MLIHLLLHTTITHTHWFYRAELQTTLAKPDIRSSNQGTGTSDEDASLTRDQALERFGIDLGRVGVMTSARTARNGGGENSSDSGQGQDTAAGAAGIASNPVGIGRENEDIKPNRTRNKRGRAGNFTTTREDDRDAVAKKRQELLSEKLKVLDKLLSDESPCLAPAEDDENNEEGQGDELHAKPGDNGPAVVVPDDNGTEKTKIAPKLVPDLSGGGGAGRGGTPDVWSLEKTPSSKGLVVMKSVHSRRDLPSKPPTDAPEPNKLTTADAAHSSYEGGAGEEDQEPATDVNGDVLLEKAPVKEVVDVERCHIYDKAFPNHR